MFQRSNVVGLSGNARQELDKFDAHASLVEMLTILKEALQNPKLISELGKNAADAIALTEHEKQMRNEAVTTIQDATATKSEIRKLSLELDEKKKTIDQEYADNLKAIEDLRDSTKAALASSKADIAQIKTNLAAATQETQDKHKAEFERLKQLEQSLSKRAVDLEDRQKHLSDYDKDLSERLIKLTEREKALFNRK